MNFRDLKIDKSWSLFLDRDGVINRRIIGGYVRTIAEFEFLPGVLDSIARYSEIFGRIFIVTNQQGIGKGLMTEDDLYMIHAHLSSKVKEAGGKIDAIYFASNLAIENNVMRKPNIGMALMAKKNYPEIDFAKSIIIGDSISDMQFGKNAGMKTVFIGEKGNEWADYSCGKLEDVGF